MSAPPAGRSAFAGIAGTGYRAGGTRAGLGPAGSGGAFPASLGAAREREMLEAAGHAVGVRTVPRPRFRLVRNTGPATVAGGDCAAPHRDA